MVKRAPIVSTNSLVARASRYRSVLDVGCGTGNLLIKITSPVKVGVDVCANALELARNRNRKAKFYEHDVAKLDELFYENEFECVCGMDILEHLERTQGEKLLDACERIADRCIMWFVPTGWCPYSRDQYHLGNKKYMTHRSTWDKEDLACRGYEVWHFPDWHKGHRHLEPEWSHSAVWCVKYLDAFDWHGGGVVHPMRRFP